ncbi:hypothetical protein [Flavobacterium collinsii]|uniref:Uncharacterized protein n=1 Tax=Flavobacterium collinsii TaxID=1114861 RepID=A0A9W4XAF2_9FLAO|nr:hypothetical protein [Flavobacterium collinsii]CAI2767664.1 conserved protein of unknown function [Flavobacterium collinsii]
MNLFPVSNYTFKIIGEQSESLDRLKRRTESSESLASKITDKSFIGTINNNAFKIISSEIGKGAFCVLSGEIVDNNGGINVEINKTFKILLSFLICLPLAGLILQAISQDNKFLILFILIAILECLMIRYIFIEFAFRILSKQSLNRLSDVLDIETLEKIKND